MNWKKWCTKHKRILIFIILLLTVGFYLYYPIHPESRKTVSSANDLQNHVAVYADLAVPELPNLETKNQTYELLLKGKNVLSQEIEGYCISADMLQGGHTYIRYTITARFPSSIESWMPDDIVIYCWKVPLHFRPTIEHERDKESIYSVDQRIAKMKFEVEGNEYEFRTSYPCTNMTKEEKAFMDKLVRQQLVEFADQIIKQAQKLARRPDPETSLLTNW